MVGFDPVLNEFFHSPPMFGMIARRDRQGYLQTGQRSCYDASGREIPCAGSGQDAEFGMGMPWPRPRFEPRDEVVLDHATGLVWTKNANRADFPMTWREALERVASMNGDGALGFSDWRLPNRRELRSLVSHQASRPALPEGHPFTNVFAGWYWTSTTAAVSPSHAWYVHMEGARMFFGGKDQSFLAWPVRGNSPVLPATGQLLCYDEAGRPVACAATGQDADFHCGVVWPQPRFEPEGDVVCDHLTGLAWRVGADLAGAVSWVEALAAITALNRGGDFPRWRLPNINELESLVDCARHGPALPAGHPFSHARDVYWSSTTSLYEPDWAWALYLDKGAVGVGQKSQARFWVWPVADLPDTME